ncbi:hypothetical protein CWO91_25490 [Bradyrhizobium genosp. SA-3]|nr:hypothetical protein CWO91_25490 [Bradyrhizobium genosp. SA-3]
MRNFPSLSMLYRSNREATLMELEHRENRKAERQKQERSQPDTEQTTLTTPLASEGLEQVRDSHC